MIKNTGGEAPRGHAIERSLCRIRMFVPANIGPDHEAPDELPSGPIVIFDGLCILCSANAQFILRHDRRQHFHLAPMQGKVGQALYRRHGIDPANPLTMIVVENGRAVKDSDAVISIYAALGWPWRLAILARAIPHFIRDPLYRFIARNRYRFFGQHDVCWIPDPANLERIL